MPFPREMALKPFSLLPASTNFTNSFFKSFNTFYLFFKLNLYQKTKNEKNPITCLTPDS